MINKFKKSDKMFVKTEHKNGNFKKDEDENNIQLSMKERKKNKHLKSARLIVRNLSFKSTEGAIKQYFSKYGDVVDVNLPKKGNKLVGCCFIQFVKKNSAAKAIAHSSGKEFLGRPIIVDWALPKDKFLKTIKKELGTKKADSDSVKEETINVESEEDLDESKDNIAGDSSSNEDSDNEESNGSLSENDDDVSQSDDDGSLRDTDESSSEEVLASKESPNQGDNKIKNKKFHFQYDPKDVSDGRTVFLKNVPFSATDDDLLNCAKELGSVIYAVICYDHLTEHSKGTAFVKFNDQVVVDDLVSGRTKLVLKGVKLAAFVALKKNQIDNMKDKKCPKDNRNLFLLREGVILAGSPAAEGVSEGDMSKRLQLEHWKTQTLKNLNKFVSTNRLVVHNIPPFLNDSKLRHIFKLNSPKGSVITEARIMRNLRDIDEKGVGRSKGFAFVTFTKHEHALEALRKINNNPTIFKDSKRPIVGFSIESQIALRVKEKRKLKSKDKLQNLAENSSEKEKHDTKAGGKKRKFSKTDEDNLPEFCGYTARPGAKKMRSGKELKMQAALHHKAVIDKKKSKKKKIHFSRNWKNNRGVKR